MHQFILSRLDIYVTLVKRDLKFPFSLFLKRFQLRLHLALITQLRRILVSYQRTFHLVHWIKCHTVFIMESLLKHVSSYGLFSTLIFINYRIVINQSITMDTDFLCKNSFENTKEVSSRGCYSRNKQCSTSGIRRVTTRQFLLKQV